MSFQPDVHDEPVDVTAAGSSRGGLGSFLSDPGNRPRLIMGGVIVVLLFIVFLLLPRTSPQPVAGTPTPDDLVARPTSVSIKGADYTIAPVAIGENGVWRPVNAGADSAEWVYGTVVNYVIGLYPTDETTQLAEGLVEGDPIVLTLSNGAKFNFRVTGRQVVPGDTVADLFKQTRPGITLVVLGETGSERLVVIGRYDETSEPLTIPDSRLNPINVPVQIGEWRVRALSGKLVTGVEPENPSQAHYFVDFVVEYLGQNPISADTFDVKLIDGVRVEYIIDRNVSNRGANPPPGGLVAPRNPTSFTAGYRVPANVPGPALVWVFKPAPDSEQEARFEVPIVKPTPTPAPNTQITVINCCTAVLNEDQTLLVLSGGIGNPTDQTVTISQIDVSLRSPDNVFSDLRVAEPPFPWVIGPQQTMAVRLQFTRPTSFSAILQIVTLQFELSGLR